MRAFVIKNKEGNYFDRHEWVEDLRFADFYINKHEFINNDETWQEITIAEGDLEQQLEEKDEEIKKLSSALDYWENNLPNQRQAIKKQVCDEIREKILIRLELPKEEWVWHSDSYVGVGLMKEILDKVEERE